MVIVVFVVILYCLRICEQQSILYYIVFDMQARLSYLQLVEGLDAHRHVGKITSLANDSGIASVYCPDSSAFLHVDAPEQIATRIHRCHVSRYLLQEHVKREVCAYL